ncbi:MAG: hypothetical protein V4649_09475 [Bacteroidota bacterium]
MDINTDKIELIKKIADLTNEIVIKKLKTILLAEKQDETDRLLANAGLTKKIREARREIKDEKGVKMDPKNLWK